MSVLYKALQKAEKDNEQRQPTSASPGFNAERIAGSGAIRLAGGRGVNWRITGLATAVILAIAIGAAFFLVEPDSTPAPRQMAAAPAPPPPVAVPVVTDGQPQAPAGEQPAAVLQPPAAETPAAAAPSPVVVAEAPAAAPAAPQVATAPTPAAPTPAAPPAATPAPPPASESIVVAPPKPAVVAQAKTRSAAPSAEPEPIVLSRAEPLYPDAKAKPPAPTVPAAAPAAKSAKAATPSTKEPMPEIAADSPARMLSPPIAVSRADFALSGVGKQVQVREVSQEAQDGVASGYNALVRGEYDTALGFYDRALTKEPTSMLGLLGRAAALQKLHRTEEAQTAYDRVLKIDPKNREALTNLTAVVAERAPGEALNRLLELEKDNPQFSPIKAQIGLTYAKMGSMQPALDYLRRAVALTPDSVMYQYNLALVLDHLGLHDQAVGAYERVLSAFGSGRGPSELSATDIERRVRFLRVR